MSITTPVRIAAMSTEMNAESDTLPTPPQLLHDLFRRSALVDAVASGGQSSRSSLQGYGVELEKESTSSTYRHSSSPSARAAGGQLRATTNLQNRSPSSFLALSMGAGLYQHRQSNIINPLSVDQNDGSSPSSRNAAAAGAAVSSSLKPRRPGALNSASQRSMSYEAKGTPRRISDEAIKMSTRPVFASSAASAPLRDMKDVESGNSNDHNKENEVDLKERSQKRISSARRNNLARRSPSPPSLTRADEAKLQRFSDGNDRPRRETSPEIEKSKASLNARVSLTKSSDEAMTAAAATSSRRRPLEDRIQTRPSECKRKEVGTDGDEAYRPVVPSSSIATSQYVTPGLLNGSRVLRSGHAPNKAPAPWSARAIKRSERHYALDKAPLRVVASQEEEEEEEEEEEQEDDAEKRLKNANVREDEEEEEEGRGRHKGAELRSRWREEERLQLGKQEEDEQRWYQRDSNSAGPSRESVVDKRSSRILGESGRDGSGKILPSTNRTPPLQVPLGADEDEEEDDYMQDHHQLQQRGGHHSPPVAMTAFAKGFSQAREVEPAARRAAMQDILAAKIPPGAVNKRGVADIVAHNLGLQRLASREVASTAAANLASVEVVESGGDFMAQVRLEAERQRGQGHLERLSSRPSKDLETKFNGFKFKKVRKAGEGGFSTVWQVRGPTAIPDPTQPGNYIDVPESEQAYFAMKQVTLKKMEKISREEVLEECNLLQSLAEKRNNEDFILRFFGWKSSTGSLKILLELGEYDFNHILREGRLSKEQIMQYWHQMLEAVHFTHEEGGIVHTDLKPANFLMANGRLKLIDFGIAQKIPVGTIHIKRDAMIGTPNYMAPETVKAVKEGARKEGRGSSMATSASSSSARVYKAGKASDVWALGCILYQMVYNRPPFDAFHGDEKLREILNPKHTIYYPLQRPAPKRSRRMDEGDEENHDREDDDEEDAEEEMERVDDAMIDVMHLTFIYNPQDRVTIPRLLSHPFLAPVREEIRRLRRGVDAHDDNDNDNDNETVPISKATLKEILRKIYAYSKSGELHESELDGKGDVLFENLLRAKHQLL
ncbi:hypothetical protein CBS101457_005188 [Exobasidium rhododendri]|nr:hypothetical protein CBS101457_005188 [Exobasidium rhododendri]